MSSLVMGEGTSRALGVGELFRRNLRRYGMLVALLAIMLFFRCAPKASCCGR